MSSFLFQAQRRGKPNRRAPWRPQGSRRPWGSWARRPPARSAWTSSSSRWACPAGTTSAAAAWPSWGRVSLPPVQSQGGAWQHLPQPGPGQRGLPGEEASAVWGSPGGEQPPPAVPGTGQPLQSFYSSEKSLLCPGCLGGHQGHPLLALPEAAQEYKDLLDGLLEPLRKEEQKLLEQRQAEEQSRQEGQEQFAAEKQKVGLALESLQELLRERQLAWLAEQEEKMEAGWGVALAQLSGEASRLQQLMAQAERNCRQPDGEFLQDIQETVDSRSADDSHQGEPGATSGHGTCSREAKVS